MRTGIFGGTFNPPHKGHAAALGCFIRSASLDRVLVIPSYLPPHKALPEKRAEFEDRLEMCKIAFSHLTSLCEVVFSDIERTLFLKTGEKNYTFKTLSELKKDSSDTFCLYVGTDMLFTFSHWKNSEYLFENAELWVMPRGDFRDGEIEEEKKRLCEMYPKARIFSINTEPTPASSTEVRAGSFTLIDEKVREYIVSRGLYE